ncbi:MAG: ketoacyl-ACP synthase III [Bacteroidia bacterium]|nr:ketoacyl-ACP synthase III [Bacteroidia bacterium]
MYAKITALGSYVPQKIVRNADLEELVETNDEWIQKRTGIKERRFAAEDEFVTEMCVSAAQCLAEKNQKNLEDVDFIIVATITGEHVMPSVASQVQHKLNIKRAGSIDLGAACAGFGYGLTIARGLISIGAFKKILVFGAEALSKHLDFEDRTTCVLFGDGAGAALVEASEENGFFGTVSGTEGELGHVLYISTMTNHINGFEVDPKNKVVQDGKKVFKWAVSTVSREVRNLLENSNLDISDIDWFIPHSANARIIDAICRDLGFPRENVFESEVVFGNTSSASIPLALYEGWKSKRPKKGDKCLLIGFGGGVTFSGTVFSWDIDEFPG